MITDPGIGFEFVTDGSIAADTEWSDDINWHSIVSPISGQSNVLLAVKYATAWRRPILAATPSNAGYANDWGATIEPGFGFIRVGNLCVPSDELWACDYHCWEPFATSNILLSFVESNWTPIRRRLAITKAVAPPPQEARWSCRHKRVPNEAQCMVCSAVYGRLIKS